MEKSLSETPIRNGLVNVQILYTSPALILNETEALLLEDLKDGLDTIAANDTRYQHNHFGKRRVNVCDNECANCHSRCKPISIPVNDATC